MKQIRWILGSASPRRKELLAGIGVAFEVRTKDTEEIYPATLSPQEVPVYLAELKAKALLPDLAEDEMVICADTVVILEGRIIGKPVDRNDAIQMLTDLSGHTHEVVTGVFVGNEKTNKKGAESTMVTFGTLTRNEIEHYIDEFKPYDKAGSYGVQEWLGYVAVERLHGTYTNVMGLPTRFVHQLIDSFNES